MQTGSLAEITGKIEQQARRIHVRGLYLGFGIQERNVAEDKSVLVLIYRTFFIFRGNTISAQMGLWSDKGFLSSIMAPSVALAPEAVLYRM